MPNFIINFILQELTVMKILEIYYTQNGVAVLL